MTAHPGGAVDAPLLELVNVTRTFASGLRLLRRANVVHAVDDISLSIGRREAVGLVGESGSGKTTIGRMVVRLLEPSSGTIRYEGREIAKLTGRDLLAYRRRVQMVFQNPFASLNPRRRVREVLRDAFDIHGLAEGSAADERMADLMQQVGLRPDMLDRYPHQFSSGQRQRIVIARALSVEPRLVVADEPVSALDVSVQAQVLNLIHSLRDELGLAAIFISHDLRAVTFLCDRIAVLYLGRIMEITSRRGLVEQPAHPYTRALLASVPSLRPGFGISRYIISGDIGDTAPVATGCVFAPRCDLRKRLGDPAVCIEQRPPLIEVGTGHGSACHFAHEAMDEPLPGPGVPLVLHDDGTLPASAREPATAQPSSTVSMVATGGAGIVASPLAPDPLGAEATPPGEDLMHDHADGSRDGVADGQGERSASGRDG